MSAPANGDDRRRFLRFLAASPLLAAAGVDLRALVRLTSDGSHDDGTLRANREGFAHFQLRARRLVNVRNVDTSVTIFGEKWETPIFVCPTGSQKMYDPEGDVATARAAKAKGHLMMLSGVTTSSVEEVNAARGKPVWYQCYPTDVEAVAHAIVRRAAKAGCPVLILTVDLNGGRNLETQLGAARLDGRNGADCHTPGVAGSVKRKPMFDGLDLSKVTSHEDPAMDWTWVKRCRAVAPQMKLVLKGIVTRDDAALAVANGVNAIVDSNHGGRRGQRAFDDRVVPRGRGRGARAHPRPHRRRLPAGERHGQGVGVRRLGGGHRAPVPVGAGVVRASRRGGGADADAPRAAAVDASGGSDVAAAARAGTCHRARRARGVAFSAL